MLPALMKKILKFQMYHLIPMFQHLPSQVRKTIINFYYILIIFLAEATTSIPRKKSKISIQMDEMKNKSKDEEYLKELDDGNEFDEFENELNFDSKKLNSAKNDVNNFAKFNTYFYFKLNENKDFIFPIQSDLFNKNKQ